MKSTSRIEFTRGFKAALVEKHRENILDALHQATMDSRLEIHTDVYWEKRVADRVNRMAEEQSFDLVIKGAHRSETLLYTPTDWQLLRGCRAPVLLVAARQWTLAKRGIIVDSVHVVTGRPEKALVDMAAKNRIGLVVLGCVGRRRLAGRVLGNTAEQILRLMKANVLAIKPGQ